MLVIRRRNYRGMFVRLFSFFAIFKLLGVGLLTGGVGLVVVVIRI